MDWKATAIAATTAGTVLLSGLTFTGTIDLQDIKSKAFGWATNVNTSVDSTKAMLDKFNIFKTDVQAQINAKIAKINELNASIATLNSKVGSGEVSLDTANTEIARLNEEIDQANAEIADLKAQIDAKDTEVAATMGQMKTTEDMNTTLTLDTQNADVAPTTGGTTGGTTTTTTDTTTPTTSDYAAEETAIFNSIQGGGYSVSNLNVAVTASTVTITGDNLGSASNYDYYIEAGLNKTVTYASGDGTNSIVYNID